jgi:hypothetical protein
MAATRKTCAFFFALALLFVTAPASASIPRTSPLDPPPAAIELDASPDVASDDDAGVTLLRQALADALPSPETLTGDRPADVAAAPHATPLHRALTRAMRVSAPPASLAETRIRASDFFAPLSPQPPAPLSRALHKAYARLNPESASDRFFAGGDPVNGRDPEGLAKKTKNGGSNWLGNLGDVVTVTGFWSGAASAALDTVGNTVSDVMMLDTWADANVVAWDSSRSGKERAIAAAKGVGVAALNVAGGEIASTAGKALLKVPGARRLVAKAAASTVGRVLATDVGALVKRGVSRAAEKSSTAVVRYDAEFAAKQMEGYGASLYDEEIAQLIVNNPAPAVGRPGGGAWVSPADEAFRATSGSELALESGLAERIVKAANAGEPIYATVIPMKGVPARIPTGAEAGANIHFTGRGFTGVRGSDFWIFNPRITEQIVPHMPMPPGAMIVKFIEGRGWVVVRGF